MAFRYCRTIRFHETDAAGVLYFSNLLTLCHEAYEAAIAAEGFELVLFFSARGEVAVPIVHTSADFYRPLVCGDAVSVVLVAKLLGEDSFEVSYRVSRVGEDRGDGEMGEERLSAIALTRHTCINPQTHKRQPLPSKLLAWVLNQSEADEPSAESEGA